MFRLIARGAVTVAVVLLVGLAAGLLVPRAMGGTTLAVLSGSMEPTIKAGDLIGVRSVDPESLTVGDIVTLQPESGNPTLVTHRIVGVGSTGTGDLTFVTQGDANTASDHSIVAGQVMGAYLYRIPLLGYVFSAAAPYRVPLLIGVGVVILLAIFLPARSRPKRDTSPRLEYATSD